MIEPIFAYGLAGFEGVAERCRLDGGGSRACSSMPSPSGIE